MIENIIRDILLAKENKAYLSALSLALTIPSILSSIANNKRSVRTDYAEWFNQWVYKYYKQPKSENELINRGLEATKFDGDNCYALRCSMLHAGNTDLKENRGTIDVFVLCSSEKSSHEGDAFVCSVSENSARDVYVSLNVVGLIDALVAGARDYLAQNNEEVQRHQNDIKRKKLFGSIDIESS